MENFLKEYDDKKLIECFRNVLKDVSKFYEEAKHRDIKLKLKLNREIRDSLTIEDFESLEIESAEKTTQL